MSLPAAVTLGRSLKKSTTLDCDACIVGSGAGGAVVAAELAEAGWNVLVLEEGGYHGTDDFTADASAMVRAMYRDGGATLALGRPPVLYQEGCTVGGSTVINGGMSWATPEPVLDRWRHEHELPGMSAKSLEPYFKRVERRIHVRPQGLETVGKDNALLKAGADKKNWNVVLNMRNQVHCAGSNNCAFGCPTGAKQSALVSYLPRAFHFGAVLYAEVRAERVVFERKRAVGVLARTKEGTPVTVRARVVVSACGAVQTPALLLRSGFRAPSGLLGKRLSLHPNLKIVAEFDEPVRGWEGVHQAYQVREFQEDGLVFAAVNVPPSLLAMSLPVYGKELGDMLAKYDHMLIAGLLCEDSSTGSVKVAPGGWAQAFYRLNDRDLERLCRGARHLCDLLFAAGARRILSPLPGVGTLHSGDDLDRIDFQAVKKRKSELELFTVHVMGTAAMGGDANRSVTDETGAVHDTAGLIVADASLFPTPIGVNPMETIQALATRNAHHLIENRKRVFA
jgi:choline dehydrogenase-like flavoprotein